ncbi:c-type cytochrome [Candidatus Magnetominusculus xianensis]|uniref:Cytochrome C n=1 Tax=Candidatus Magnetominusculus xianensis TaxID=1748249 RepID=A0ABR5SFH7_9BACT|nr:c-type cytochrome [Candidatus Magnetominusculus xianensis]KWT76423.1 cytochrome C [Candidatus Magnetominusculus xianensis]MBF0404892.1 c-type cytochrome [Nitrospirota bacterium]
MKSSSSNRISLSFIALLVGVSLLLAGFWADTNAADKPVKGADGKGVDGKKVYESRCVICHGAKGDGKGLVDVVHRNEKKGMVWSVFPRDFTSGTFKFRSTPTGCLPTDADLARVIAGGIPRAYMPSSSDLSDESVKAVIKYIKTFSKRWTEEEACKPIPIKKASFVGTAESVKKGEVLYDKMKCWECHGKEGRGDGSKSDSLKDDWGDKVLPFDFTSGATKMGFAPENVYAAYTTGLDGTGMPSFQDSLSEEDRWNLVSYTLKLMGRLQ